MGNSEVGHMNIGAGRVVMQDLPRVDLAIEDGSLAQNPALLAATRDKLQRNRLTTPLYDSARFAANIEAAYKAMLA